MAHQCLDWTAIGMLYWALRGFLVRATPPYDREVGAIQRITVPQLISMMELLGCPWTRLEPDVVPAIAK